MRKQRTNTYTVSLHGESRSFDTFPEARDWLALIGPDLPGKLTVYTDGKPGDVYTLEELS